MPDPKTEQPTEETRQRHNRLYDEACKLVQGELPVHPNEMQFAQEPELRGRLAKALGLLDEVNRLNPDNWTARWLAGMVCRRLGDLKTALEWFDGSAKIVPPNFAFSADVYREAGITATELRKMDDAIRFSQMAVDARPKDAGLWSNLALANLFNRDVEKAKELIDKALAMEPDDKITLVLRQIIDAVRAGTISCPTHHDDIQTFAPVLGLSGESNTVENAEKAEA
jgi:tetratricopeptide (TPR) repeat protein